MFFVFLNDERPQSEDHRSSTLGNIEVGEGNSGRFQDFTWVGPVSKY